MNSLLANPAEFAALVQRFFTERLHSTEKCESQNNRSLP